LHLLQEAGERVRITGENPTSEAIARMIFDYLKGQGYPVTDVTLWETGSSCAGYRPA
jgi:6-pyruvoyltetrahydropterin/6-carboxytetrahydropterin synthase